MTETGTEAGTVAVLIVSYHTGPSLFLALDRVALERSVGAIILVDNGNDDATRAELVRREASEPRLTLVSGQGNVGFARACNLAAARASLPYLLLLNPDCLIEPGALDRLLGRVRDLPQPWIATLRLMNPDGSEQRGCRRNLATPGNCLSEALGLWRLPGLGRWRLNLAEEPVPNDLARVPAISGAFMLMPRTTYATLGGMDEGYFLHVEDLDLCARLAAAGGSAWFLPQASATHLKGTSSASPFAVERHKAAGFRRYFCKHAGGTPHLARALIWVLLAAGLLVKGALASLGGNNR